MTQIPVPCEALRQSHVPTLPREHELLYDVVATFALAHGVYPPAFITGAMEVFFTTTPIPLLLVLTSPLLDSYYESSTSPG